LTTLLRAKAIEKQFGGIRALRKVDFTLEESCVHALLGENGAGKSTLIKIFSGVYPPDGGEIEIDGKVWKKITPSGAKECGIATIYQETSLYRDLSVLENLFMGRQPNYRFGIINWNLMRVEAKKLFNQLGVDIPLTAKLGDLGKATIQLVEIAKALSQKARILIMDEPTSALSENEVERLFEIVKVLRAQGTSIIYISHRLEEIFRIADIVTILRDGQITGHSPVSEVDREWVVQKMIGQQLKHKNVREFGHKGDLMLRVKNLTQKGAFENISFKAYEGEILAIAGLIGSGSSELAKAIFGIEKFQSGKIFYYNSEIKPSPFKALSSGIGFVPEDRTSEGLILPLSAELNLLLSAMNFNSSMGFLNFHSENLLSQNLIKSVDLRPPIKDLPASSFSGGNQQKIVLGKWLGIKPRLLILNEPTQGVDIKAKAEIHRLMNELVNNGVGILLISSDLQEILEMSDRILSMYNGKIVAEFPRGSNAKEIMQAASGIYQREKNVH
jgi:ABC-type sugar transport system ATPase subunit